MSKRVSRIVEQVRAVNPFADAFARGHSPEEVKQELFDLFAPYSTNHEALLRYVVEFMVPDAVSLTSIQSRPGAMNLFRQALRFHRDALARDRRASLQALPEYTADINEGLSVFWSQYHLARDLDELEPEEFVHECLRMIGTVIEGPLKPHVHELAHQARIAKGQSTVASDIRAASIGGLIHELSEAATDPHSFEVRGVRLSQWRNIAQHLSAIVDADAVVCPFGKGQFIGLSLDELKETCQEVLSAFKALKVAHCIVVFDCIDEMKAEKLIVDTGEQRVEASLTVLISGLASQGFEVVESHFDEKESRLIVQDISFLDPDQRRVHSSQFVIDLYYQRPAEVVVVEYRERDGTPSLKTTATRELIERAARIGDWDLVAQECHCVDLKS
jgi:hypothetical protein